MMKISEMGVFILYINNFQQYILEDEINLICIIGNRVLIGKEALTQYSNADAIFIICIMDEKMILIRISGHIYINNYKMESIGYELIDNSTISTDDMVMQFKFVCNEQYLEDIIDVFMNGNLEHALDIDLLFYEYAKKIKITDKGAISNVMAAIDIPEIDKL